MRKTIVTLHRLFGLSLGLIVVVVCGTGALLAFEDEVTTFLNRSLIRSAGSPIGPDTLYSLVNDQLAPGEQIKRMYVPLGRVRIQGEGAGRELFFDPQDGKFLGVGNPFMSKVLELHRTLLLSRAGRWLTLISALGMLFLSLTGLKLWWPLKKHKLRQSFTIKTTGSQRRLFLDLHRVGGVFVVLPFLLIALTGLNYSLVSDAYRGLVHKVTRTPAPPVPLAISHSTAVAILSLEQALIKAQETFPDATITSIDPPKDSSQPLTVRLRHPGQPDTFGRSTVEFDPYRGTTLRATDATQLPMGYRFTSVWALPLHRGRAFGLPHQLLWLLTALIGVTLPMTGAWLWWNKQKPTTKGRPERVLP